MFHYNYQRPLMSWVNHLRWNLLLSFYSINTLVDTVSLNKLLFKPLWFNVAEICFHATLTQCYFLLNYFYAAARKYNIAAIHFHVALAPYKIVLSWFNVTLIGFYVVLKKFKFVLRPYDVEVSRYKLVWSCFNVEARKHNVSVKENNIVLICYKVVVNIESVQWTVSNVLFDTVGSVHWTDSQLSIFFAERSTN